MNKYSCYNIFGYILSGCDHQPLSLGTRRPETTTNNCWPYRIKTRLSTTSIPRHDEKRRRKSLGLSFLTWRHGLYPLLNLQESNKNKTITAVRSKFGLVVLISHQLISKNLVRWHRTGLENTLERKITSGMHPQGTTINPPNIRR